MLEALVDRKTGDIVGVRTAGQPWGSKEGRSPDSTHYVVKLKDPEVEARYKQGSFLTYPYAEWKEYEYEKDDGDEKIQIMVGHRMVRKSNVQMPIDELPKMVFDEDRCLVSTDVKDANGLDRKPLLNAGNVVGAKPCERIKEGVEIERN